MRLRLSKNKYLTTLLQQLAKLSPLTPVVRTREKIRACCGTFLGIAITAAITALLVPNGAAWLLAPIGASAVLLFATPASPLAQPWSILGGNIASALVAIFFAHWWGPSLFACASIVMLTLLVMLILRCLHPPGGAIALGIVFGHSTPAIDYSVLGVVVANSALLVMTAIFFHRLTHHSYPHKQPKIKPSAISHAALRIEREDLEKAIATNEEMLDISLDDLEWLLRRAEELALARFDQSHANKKPTLRRIANG